MTGADGFHRLRRPSGGRLLWFSVSARSAAVSDVTPAMNSRRHSRSRMTPADMPRRSSTAAARSRHSAWEPGGAVGGGALGLRGTPHLSTRRAREKTEHRLSQTHAAAASLHEHVKRFAGARALPGGVTERHEGEDEHDGANS